MEPGTCGGCGADLDGAPGRVASSVQVFGIPSAALTQYQMRAARVRAGSGHGFSWGEAQGSACAGGAGARPYLGPRDSCGLGDMMIDGVVPLGCGRASLSRPSIPGNAGMAAGQLRGAGQRGWPRCIGGVRAAACHPHQRHRPAGRGA
jgi:hypothetical protein